MYMSESHAHSGLGMENIRLRRAAITIGGICECSGSDVMSSSNPEESEMHICKGHSE